ILSAEYDILSAKSGEKAIQLSEENRPDLNLLDVFMPGLDGFETLAKLKASETVGNIPVIFITGLVGDKDEEKGFIHGAVDYIKKPFSGIVVKARIQTQLQSLRYLRSLEEASKTDPLTGLPNRRKFNEHLRREWKRVIRVGNPISFMMMDIDKFKVYNDTYGHPQGDELLKAAGKIFLAAVRRPEDLAARLGGEEFGILLPNTSLGNAIVIAEKVRAEIEAMRVPTADESAITGATISIGVVSVVPKPKDAIEDFIESADKNLYTAKATGRNRVCAGD
ncbi:MAG: diguanylate cyclase, partial [Oscillospiraceae bacterium]|nr:diguanylate cyclase [Oscillospiraceae bacterium]